MRLVNKKHIGIVVLGMFCTISSLSQNKGLFSVMIDPKMLIVGPYETSEHGELDIIFKIAHHNPHHEIGLYSELFSAIGYYSFGMFYNYKFLIESEKKDFNRFVFPVGIELGFIKRKDEVDLLEYSFALNGSIRYFLVKNWAIEVNYRWIKRSDLTELYDEGFLMKSNMYTGLVYVW